MKSAIKTIVDSIEKEISTILENSERPEIHKEVEFEFGTFEYELTLEEIPNELLDPWDSLEMQCTIEVKNVTVTNENNKTLTNLSNEVFNQLETTYTNY